jgi:predicted amidohydrolase
MLMTQRLIIALAQIDCYLKKKEKNIAHALEILEQVKGNADIICFPELFTTGYNLDAIGSSFYELSEEIPGETTEILCKKARQNKIVIIGGIVEKDSLNSDILYDSVVVINKEGEIAGKYRKYFLYPLEHRYFKAGNMIPVFDLGNVRVGTAICYDHAFPELFRTLALKGAQIIFILSAIPEGFEYLLNLRARARAQDNQVFIAHVNRVGQKDGGLRYCGLSKIVNPRGEVIAEASPASEDVIIETVNLEMIMQEKKQERITKSLRAEIYQDLKGLI